MNKVGKKHKKAAEQLKQTSIASWRTALDFVVKNAHARFDESVDVDIILGIDPTKGDQVVRGAALLPHGTGRKIRVLVFAQGEYEEAARKAGADYVGGDDLAEKIQGGWLDFEAAIATPDMMGVVSKVAKILGPRGLLPNNKVGTVTFDVAGVISDLKRGRVNFRNDKGGIVHASFGRVSFGVEKLLENLASLVAAIQGSKPASSKGKFLRKMVVSSTMGVGVAINPDENV